MNNNQERWKIMVLLSWIAIFGIIAYISLAKFSSLGTTPDNIGLRPDGSDLARVMYETGTLIVCLATLILAATAFIVPFTIHMWSEMSDSFFDLFIQTIHDNQISEQLKREVTRKIKDDVMKRFSRMQYDIRVTLYTLLIMCFITLLLLAIIAIGAVFGWNIFCWNIVQYLWLRAILFIVCIVFAIGFLFLITKFMGAKPEITKRELQMKIMIDLSEKLAGQVSVPSGSQDIREDKKNAEKEK